MNRNERGTVLGAAIGAAAVAAAVLAAPSMASAQAQGVGPWLPFMGCWSDVEAPADAPLTCVVPAEAGAEILTVAEEGVVERQLLRADGAEHAFSSGGCEGAQASEAASDGHPIFTRSRLSCDGGVERSTRGIMAMVDLDEWVDIRALTVGSGSVSWVKRYRVAAPYRLDRVQLTEGERAELERVAERRGMAIEAVRVAAAGAPSIDAIIEAHNRTDNEAVRAWITELAAPLDLGADELLRLADAGVSPDVIDVAVAVSYPERFALARRTEQGPDAERRERAYDSQRYRYGSWYYDPFNYDPFYRNRYYYDRYRYGFGSGFGSYGPGWYGGPGVIVVQPAETERKGRFVKGRGYTTNSPSSPDAPRAVPTRPTSSGNGSSARANTGTSSSGSKGKAKRKDGNN